MERSTVLVASAPQKCHFSEGKTNIRECHRQKCHPCYGKTIRAESGPFVVVGFACMARIIFSNFLMLLHFFSPNALKRVTLENPPF